MNAKNLFINNNRLKALWRILIFIFVLMFAISPLLLVRNSYLQFFGALLMLIFGLYLNSKYLDKRDFSEYGLVYKKETFVHLLIGITIGFLSVVLMLFIGKTTGVLLVSETTSTPSLPQLSLFALKMLLVGILEETFFRGYLFTNIYDGVTCRYHTPDLS